MPDDPFFQPDLFDFLRQPKRHRLGDRRLGYYAAQFLKSWGIAGTPNV